MLPERFGLCRPSFTRFAVTRSRFVSHREKPSLDSIQPTVTCTKLDTVREFVTRAPNARYLRLPERPTVIPHHAATAASRSDGRLLQVAQTPPVFATRVLHAPIRLVAWYNLHIRLIIALESCCCLSSYEFMRR